MKARITSYFSSAVAALGGLLLIGGVGVAIPEIAVAQIVLEEIVVTARKRSESLNDVPASVQAFDASDIEQAGIVNMRDYINLTPNMNLVETQNSGFAFVNIRGLSQVRNVDPTVAVVIDGVLVTTGLGFTQDLFDIEQIEVLKGPQGALYGRNATGGAINITTKQPSNDTEGFIRAGLGDGGAFGGSAVLSGALSEDKLLGRVAVGYKEADGWRDNVSTGREADFYENYSLRGKLIWQASENVNVDFRGSFSDSSGVGAAFVSNAPNFVNGSIPGSPAPPNNGFPVNGSAPVLDGVPGPIRNLIGDPNNTSVQIASDIPGIDDREILELSTKIDWETSFGTITSVTSYDELDAITVGDNFPYYPFSPQIEGTGLARLNNTFGQNRFHSALSQELRITSNADQSLRWIVGAYVVGTELDTLISTNDDNNTGVVEQDLSANIGTNNDTESWNNRFLAAAVPALGALFGANPAAIPAACLAGGGGPLAGINIPVCAGILANPNTNPAALSVNVDRAENTAYALFGQINYDLSDVLELSVALRFDKDDREQTVRTPQGQLPNFAFGGAFEGEVREEEFDSLQPKVTLRWKPSDDVTLYGLYAEGFRSGGFNLSGVAAGVNALASAGIPGMPAGVFDQWQQEDSQSFELGFKGSAANDRFKYSGAVFHTNVDDAFAFTFVAQLTAQIIRNVDEAEITGVELSGSWLATEHLQFDLNLGFLDSEINASSWMGAGGVNIVGNELPYNPDHTINFGLTYQRPLSETWSGYLRLDYQQIGELFFEVENFAARDQLNFVNVRLGFGSDQSGWDFAFWAKNLTDEDYIADLINPNGITYYGKLRQVGFEATKRFQ